jgi:hypothetical protein
MDVTRTSETVPWLLLVFNLPSEKASQRVGIWRKLQKFGTFPLRNSGYVLPDTPSNRERFEWLATSIRGFKGEASVLQVRAIDDLPDDVLKERFRESRKPDYVALIREIQALKPSESAFSTQLARLKRRLEEIIEIDFFDSPLRSKAQEALHLAERPAGSSVRTRKGQLNKDDFQGRVWITRPRPGIDRISSGWLIRRFIDSSAEFVFGNRTTADPDAVPFDMYQSSGFGHEGDHCTFETLCNKFGIRDRKVTLIARAIHDADIEDEKYHRNEGIVINQVLKGWADQGLTDEELMQRGMDVIEGLYRSIT